MKWTEIKTGRTHGAFQHFMVALGDQADVVVERINNEPAFAERLAAYAQNGGTEATVSQTRARDIMGKNFFGIGEAIKHFVVNPSRRQLAVLAKIPFSEAELKQAKDTHVLAAVFPLSIIAIRIKMPGTGLFGNRGLDIREYFAKESGEIAWQLVRKTPADNSLSVGWQEQKVLISKDDEVPTAQLMVYTIIGHFLATGERLFERVHVRTSSFASGSKRVNVGGFDTKGLYIGTCWDYVCLGNLGVSSARKLL